MLTLEPILTLSKMSTCLLFTKQRDICDLIMGEQAFALGVGDFSIRFPGTNDIYVISHVYWVPNDTANNISSEAMKLFSGFRINLIEPLEYFDFIDYSRSKFSCATTVNNNMNYLKLNVIRPTKVLG